MLTCKLVECMSAHTSARF